MRRAAFLSATCVLVAIADAAGTHVSGGIYFDEVWDADGSPYELAKNSKIAENTTVLVKPGAIVHGNGFKLFVVGTLLVRGEKDHLAQITDLHLTPGRGDTGVIDIAFANLNTGSLFAQEYHTGYKGTLQLRDSMLRDIPDIFLFFPPADCRIERNVFAATGGISSGTTGVEVAVRNNVFYMQTSDFAVKNWHRQPLIKEYKSDRRPDVYPKDMIVQYNSFLCTDRTALRMDQRYSDAEMRVAQENYFGTWDPLIVADMVFDKTDDIYVSEKIKYAPFLLRRHENTPKEPKFDKAWCSAPDIDD